MKQKISIKTKIQEMKNKISLNEHLLKLARDSKEWINGGEFERLAMQLGYKGSTAGRNLRDLSETDNSPLMKEKRKGKEVASMWYKARGPKEVIPYYVNGVKVSEKVIW